MLYPSAVCVVDPAIIECIGLGFAAFLLKTLDHIRFCGFLGIHRPVVYWRACGVVCSRNPRVNSWNWYFEPVNPGLEIQVEKVLCIILPNEDVFGGRFIPILDSSFRKRSMMKGYEHSKIITDRERKKVNQLMNQYVTPNSRIKEKVRVFYDRHLAGFNLLGVHVRGTDHWMETPEQKLPPLLSWVNKAAEILKTLPHPRKVFIASDNDEVIENFVEFFGKEKKTERDREINLAAEVDNGTHDLQRQSCEVRQCSMSVDPDATEHVTATPTCDELKKALAAKNSEINWTPRNKTTVIVFAGAVHGTRSVLNYLENFGKRDAQEKKEFWDAVKTQLSNIHACLGIDPPPTKPIDESLSKNCFHYFRCKSI
ncbi:hypothetical protein P5673_027720 [Acropora cervicornis]|uniref:Uncharacterized protein n=1 Tax=Acropora cervicornis TaxID=6130 RepID=A0AAD9PYJ8_ACRCE|nr:hypothetical protein P5673_027720 [Acropora cervicornis]